MPGATPCPTICHGARKSSPWKARSGSACAAERSAAVSATRKRKSSTSSRRRYFVRVIKREKLACHKCPGGRGRHGRGRRPEDRGKGQALRRCGRRCAHQEIPLPSAALPAGGSICTETTRSKSLAARCNAAVMTAGELLLPVAAVLEARSARGRIHPGRRDPDRRAKPSKPRAATTRPTSSNTAGPADRWSSTFA